MCCYFIFILPAVPPAPRNVTVVNQEIGIINLYILQPNSKCHITANEVTWKGNRLWGNNASDSNSRVLEHPELEEIFEIDSLIPYSQYKICVTASTTAGFSEEELCTMPFSTMEDCLYFFYYLYITYNCF